MKTLLIANEYLCCKYMGQFHLITMETDTLESGIHFVI